MRYKWGTCNSYQGIRFARKQGLKMLHTWQVSAHNTNKDFSRYKWRTVPNFSLLLLAHTFFLWADLFFCLLLFALFFWQTSTRDLDLNTHFGGSTKITMDELKQQEHAAETLAKTTHELIWFFWLENTVGIRSNKDGWKVHGVGFPKCTKTPKTDSGWQRYTRFGGGCRSEICGRKQTQTHKNGWGKLSNYKQKI